MPFSHNGSHVEFHWSQVLSWREAEIRRQLEDGAGGADIDLRAEQARLTRERADAQEMENALRRKELVAMEDVERMVRKSLERVAAVLRRTASTCAPSLARRAKISQKAAHRILAEMVEEVKAELRNQGHPEA